MANMMNSRVLVSGLSGLGVEIAKNVILAGVKSFVVHDTAVVEHSDLSSQFYCNTRHIGKNRALACVAQLRELNDLVPVEVLTSELSCTVESLGSFTVVVLVGYHETKLRKFGDYCHANGICMIATGTYGLYGYSFSDFGASHVVSDVDGEAPKAGLVVSFEQLDDPDTQKEHKEHTEHNGQIQGGEGPEQKGHTPTLPSRRVVIRSDSEKTGLSDGDHVSLSILGSTIIFPITSVYKKVERKNTKTNTVRTVKVRDFALFSIEMKQETLNQFISSEASGSNGPGYWTQVKVPTTIHHHPFSTAIGHQSKDQTIKDPPSLVNDPWSPSIHLHSLLRGIWNYQTSHNGALPTPYNEKEAYELVESGWSSTFDKDKNEESLLMTLAMGCRGQLNPMAAIFGGVVGQEVIKACSGKYTPIGQWLHLESCDCLPRRWSKELGPPLTTYDTTPQQNRYDGQIVTLGRSFQSKIATSKIF